MQAPNSCAHFEPKRTKQCNIYQSQNKRQIRVKNLWDYLRLENPWSKKERKKIQHKTSINPKPKHMQVETAYTKSRTRTWHPYMNVVVPSVISQHSPHEEQHDCHFFLKLLLNIRDASNFRKWTVCSVQWLSQLLKRGKKQKKKTVTKWKDLSKYSGSVYVLQEKKMCAHFGNGQLLDGCKRLSQSLILKWDNC